MTTLIIDSLNMFIRSYIANPSLSLNGEPIGGILGYFKSLQKLCNESNASRIVIAWDGSGGSRKKRQQNSNYKQGRRPIHLNRSTKIMSQNQEIENKIWQETRLFECLNCLPVIQFLFNDTEADDIIAAVCNILKDEKKVIVSSDKDFLQLVNNKTILYRPIQKEILTEKDVIEKYGIHPNNMCLARSIEGDKSDNLKGVSGIALKGIKSRLSFLKEENKYPIRDVINYCKEMSKDSKIKFYNSIIDSEDLIYSNYKLMQLSTPNMSYDTKERIEYTLENVEYEFNKTQLEVYMMKDGWPLYNWQNLFRRMSKIMSENKRRK